MKIGVSSYSFSKYLADTKCGYEAICDIAKNMGFDGIELRMTNLRLRAKSALTAIRLGLK